MPTTTDTPQPAASPSRAETGATTELMPTKSSGAGAQHDAERESSDRVVPEHTDTNEFRITGTLSKAAYTRVFASGSSLTRLSVTVRSDYGHRRADGIPVSVWNARKAVQAGERGDRIEVEGRLQRRFWTRRDGGRDSSVELVASSVSLSRS